MNRSHIERWLGPVQSADDEQRAQAEWQQFLEAECIISSSKTYRHFTVEEERVIAFATLDLFDAATYPDTYLPHQILAHLAAVMPESLKGFYPLLLERDPRCNGMFRKADPATRDRLIALLEAEEPDEDTRKRAVLLSDLALVAL